MPVIEARNITKVYETDGIKTPVLHGVSFSIESGEFVAIMGPSGSGKSTLLHILGFLDHHTDGQYEFNGKVIDDYTASELARVRNQEMGFVFQSFNLLPRSTVLENVKLPLLYSEISPSKWDQKAKAAIRAVGLEHREDFEALKLSGGEKQRVAIARALVNDAQIIFADEPTGNLDSKSGQMVMKYLEDLNKEGHTIILITHETYTAEHAQRVLYIRDGKIESDKKVKKQRHAEEEFVK